MASRSFVKAFGLEMLIALCRIFQMHRGRGAAFVFHAIGLESPVSIDEVEFWRKARYLRSMGFQVASVSEGIRQLAHKGACTVFTFDDAYENITRALLRFADSGWSATVYVVTGRIGTHNTWDTEKPEIPRLSIMDAGRIRQLHSRGIEFGAHTVNHVSLDGPSRAQIHKEVSQSKKQLEAVINHRVTSFAFPYGAVSPESMGAVGSAGFETALTTRLDYWRARENHRLGRFSGQVDFDLFRLIVHGGYGLYRSLWRIINVMAFPLSMARRR